MNLSQKYLERVALKSKPNLAFNNNWNSYSTRDFGSVLLASSNMQSSGNLRVYDAAELVSGVDSQEIISIGLFGIEKAEFSMFSFSKASKASQVNDKIKLSANEFSVFIEVQDEREALVSFKFGREIAERIDLLLENQSNDIQSRKFETALNDIQKAFNARISERDILNFSLNTMGLEMEEISADSFEKLIEDAFSNNLDLEGVLFDSGFKQDSNPYAWAHGDIEKQALEGVFTDAEILQIYYGNWLRDYSSVVTEKTVGFDKVDRDRFDKLPFNESEVIDSIKAQFINRLSYLSWIKIIELLAANEFVYKQPGVKSHDILKHIETFSKRYDSPSRKIVGFYRPEEHIDNPKGLIDASILGHGSLEAPISYPYTRIGPSEHTSFIKKMYAGEVPESLEIKQSKMKAYIKDEVDPLRPSSFQYFSEQMRLAKRAGKNKKGFRHFGAALHVLEDYFAHSNFVEVALIKNGYKDVYPWVQDLPSEFSDVENAWDKASHVPMVTGYFGQLDIIASLSPKLASEFFGRSFEEYKNLKSGERSLQDELIRIILDDRIEKEKGMKEADKFTFLTLTYEDMKAKYQYYLYLRDKLRKSEETPYLEPVITASKITLYYLGESISFLPILVSNIILNGLDEGVQSFQTLSNSFGSDPSHSQLAKDHADHHFNDIAGLLAYFAVKKVGNGMKKCWDGDLNVESIIDYVDKNYFVHPCSIDWMDEAIKIWSNANSPKLIRGESKTSHEHGIKEFNKLKNRLAKKLESFGS